MAKRCIKPLVPIDYLQIEDALINSIKNFGQINPVILSGGKIVDGIKRFYILKKLKKKIDFEEREGDPFFLRFNLNLQRKFTLPEIAFIYLNSPKNLKKEILKISGIPPYPEIEEIFNLLLSQKGLIKLSILNKINFSNLKDLIIWEEKAGEISKSFSQMKGTFSELKNVSSLLKKAKIEGIENLKFKKNAKEMEIYLKKLLYPNYMKDLKNFKEKINKLKVPKGLKIKEKDFFEDKEIEILINLNEENFEDIFEFLFENREKIKEILKKLP